MKMIRNILALGVMVILLVSTMGYTIERHFCNHCNLSFETAWFLVPGGTGDPAHQHQCDCEHEHHSGKEKGVCYGSCEVNRAVHVKHVQADINSFLIEKQIFDLVPTAFYNSNLLTTLGLWNRLQNRNLYLSNKPPLPSLCPIHISLCVYRL